MFDYKLLAALAAVVEQGGFERAAQLLGLSQSAVSQRIKLLEARVGQPVLLRAAPPIVTRMQTWTSRPDVAQLRADRTGIETLLERGS